MSFRKCAECYHVINNTGYYKDECPECKSLIMLDPTDGNFSDQWEGEYHKKQSEEWRKAAMQFLGVKKKLEKQLALAMEVVDGVLDADNLIKHHNHEPMIMLTEICKLAKQKWTEVREVK